MSETCINYWCLHYLNARDICNSDIFFDNGLDKICLFNGNSCLQICLQFISYITEIQHKEQKKSKKTGKRQKLDVKTTLDNLTLISLINLRRYLV